MNLTYHGINRRKRAEWIDAEHGLTMEEWQVARYRNLVTDAERCTGRKLTKREASLMEWISGGEQDTCNFVRKLMSESYENGKNNKFEKK